MSNALTTEKREIAGYEGLYEAWSDGAIFSVIGGHRLKPGYGSGYHYVTLCANKIQRMFSVHGLICCAFNGHPPTPKHEPNHKDGNKLNNTPTNLEWMTRAQNQRHAADIGLKPRGQESHLCTKLDESKVRQIKALKGIHPQTEIASQFGISQTYVGKIHRGLKWRHITV